MNVEIGTETFLFWEYLFQNFGILSLQCTLQQQIQLLLISNSRQEHKSFFSLALQNQNTVCSSSTFSKRELGNVQ
jgi:hypothetical protein